MADKIITPEMKIYNIVKEYPNLMDVLIEESPKFKKLTNKIVFNTMAKITDVREAAKIGNLEVDDLLLALNKNIGQEQEYLEARAQLLGKEVESEEDKTDQEWRGLKESFNIVDVRELGDDTFSTIMELADKTKEQEGFCVIQKFEPTPLYKALSKRGFEYLTEQIGEEEYKTYFYKVK